MTSLETNKLPRAIRVTFWLLLLWSVVVLQQWLFIVRMGLGRPEGYVNIFYYLFANYELIAWLVFVVGLVMCVSERVLPERFVLPTATTTQQRLGLFAVLALLWCGTVFIHHRYPFSMDEFGTLFQAKIFASGHLKASIPEAFRPWAFASTPIFVTHDPHASTWMSDYMPMYACLRTLFLEVNALDLLNPVLAAASLYLIADCARRLWPAQPSLRVPLIAAALLLTSAQFLAMSISYYSMPAHLCANLLWLSLYLRDTRWTVAFLPWLGGLALGLHAPIPHAMFVAPFCLDILRRKRFGLALYCLVVYSSFLVLWFNWRKMTVVDIDLVARDMTLFRWPDTQGVFDQTVNMTLLVTWQSVALVLGCSCALLAFKRFNAALWNLTFGIVLSLGFYSFFYKNQGHGWGYRYVYGAFGNVVLLATFGWMQLAEKLGERRSQRFLVVSTCFALVVQIPLRAFEIEHEIRPFARARDFLRAIPEKFAVVDHRFIFYGQDLIRNDPLFGSTPLVLDASRVPRNHLSDLQRLGSVRLIGPRELAALKMQTSEAIEQLGRERAQAEVAPKP